MPRLPCLHLSSPLWRPPPLLVALPMGTHPNGVFGRHPTTDMGDDRVCGWGGGGGG